MKKNKKNIYRNILRKKYIFGLIISIAIFNNGYSQELDTTKSSYKWEAGIFYSFSSMSTGGDLFIDETSNLPLGLSIYIGREISRNISMETGLAYMFGKFKSLYDNQTTNIYNIPLNVKYYIRKDLRFSFNLIGGITNSFYNQEKIFYYKERPIIVNIKYYTIIFHVGLGGLYKINNRWKILLEPSIGIEFHDENTSIEIRTGLCYSF